MIKLIGKSRKGANIINRWGDLWSINSKTSAMLFISSTLDIDYSDSQPLPDSARWVDKVGDINFNIEYDPKI